MPVATYFRCKSNLKDLLCYALSNRDNGYFEDVTLQAGNSCIAANRLVLSCYSSFFEQMFKSQMKERYLKTIKIEKFDGEAVAKLVDYIYTGKIVINDGNVLNVLVAAHFFGMKDAIGFCFDHLKANLSFENCYELFSLAELYSNQTLKAYVQQYIHENFIEITMFPWFKNFSKAELITFISSLDRSLVAEISVSTAILMWVAHDYSEREADFAYLLKLLNFEKLSATYLKQTFLEESSQQSVKMPVSMYKKATNTLLTKLHAASQNEKGLRIFGVEGLDSNLTVQVYSYPGEHAPLPVPKLPFSKTITGHSALKYDGQIFCIGGNHDDKKASSFMYGCSLSSRHLGWTKMGSMTVERCHMGSEIFCNSLVVAGGFSNRNHLATAETYNVVTNKWSSICSMNYKRSGNVLVVCKRNLYSIGGYDGSKCLSVMEKLPSLCDEWFEVTPMQVPRRSYAAVNCNGEIYAIGGLSGVGDQKKMKSVEKFSPITNTWRAAPDLIHGRYDHLACVVNCKIFVIGGRDAAGNPIHQIECYDPLSNTWCIVGKTPHELIGSSLIVV